MFTGLIECMGTVNTVDLRGTSITLGICPDLSHFNVVEGGSVAVDGACLTLERSAGASLYFTAVRETLKRTTLRTVVSGRRVNLERALKLGDRLDGHMVLGHIDGVGRILRDVDVGGSLLRTIAVPSELGVYMAQKGSITIDGISLTVSQVSGEEITVSLIPATIKKTTMFHKGSGDQVNIECDVLARYLVRILGAGKEQGQGESKDSLLGKMERLGF